MGRWAGRSNGSLVDGIFPDLSLFMVFRLDIGRESEDVTFSKRSLSLWQWISTFLEVLFTSNKVSDLYSVVSLAHRIMNKSMQVQGLIQVI